MKFVLFFVVVISIAPLYAQNIIQGRVLSENNFPIGGVMIINIQSKTIKSTDKEGNFKIEAKTNDELRFLKDNFERGSKSIQNKDFLAPISIQLIQVPIQIKEVVVAMRPTGNLEKDACRIKIDISKKILQKEIGLPQPKGIQREKIPVLTKDVLLPLLAARLNIDAIYKLVSSDARRMRNIYKYEDMQRSINWISERNGDEYFIKKGIPKDKIREFLEFSILTEPQIAQNIKFNNLSAVNFELENATSIYLERLKK